MAQRGLPVPPALDLIRNDEEFNQERCGHGFRNRVSDLKSRQQAWCHLVSGICALLLVSVFAVSFLGTKMAYEQYDNFCNSRYDVYRLKNFGNISAKDRFVPYRFVVHAE
ncbi:hypothetical protein MSG28_003070 [Choristoneura fumiferana]|uniref:Uncharacterized protein n=1 Tax=Choristoneura fumiferana TaxID=7141 RepID=A0ACC0JKF7_CHOFU|nr:hypothetical protein MSG28_003070 [Choristoneura fumiferana]